MKKIILAILGMLLLVSCAPDENTVNEEPQHIQVYYLNTDTDMLSAEEYNMPPKDNVEKLISSTIEHMMQDREGDVLKSVFPENTKLLDTEFDHGIARLYFSKEYLQLKDFDKTAAECAIALSLANFWNVDSTEIYVEGNLVTADLKRENFITELPKGQG